ncbi:MAG: DUF2341 domain-containing protein [Desulfurococcales archaeon]|nr:DUF2341 domain-containing protein [Desulfurococcales archaeon]
MNILSRYHNRKAKLGLSTVIATLFLVIILFSILAFIYVSLNRIGKTITAVNNALERKTVENELKVNVLDVEINSTGLIVKLKNTGYRSIGLIKYYIRDRDTNQFRTGDLNTTVLPGETKAIFIQGSFDPTHNYTIVLIDAYGGTIRASYPYTPPVQPISTPKYSIVYLEQTLDGYTVASLGYNFSSPIQSSYDTYKIRLGTLENTNPLKVESNTTITYNLPEGWKYYKKIVIKENTGQDLTDYAVPIFLNSTNFNFSKAKNDGSDIRFVASDNRTFLDYWIQYWNSASDKALVWVKLNLPGGENTTIYMLYGNPSASYDSAHYGLTKVMATLPLNDGSNYYVYYMPYNMGTSLFNSNQGNPQNWHADDGYWSYNLQFDFPFYNDVINTIYVSSNGFIKKTSSYATDWTSTTREFEQREMISPFWADLMTNTDSDDIFINSTYSDNFGSGVLIRWKTQFYPGNGDQEFDVVLYRNGLIRMDYGSITGTSSTDDSPVIGISLGDGNHYTLLTPSNNVDPSDWNGHDSILYWPRKNATVEPSVYIYPSDQSDYENVPIQVDRVSVGLAWNQCPLYAFNATISVDITGSSEEYDYVVTPIIDGTVISSISGSLSTGTNDIIIGLNRICLNSISLEVNITSRLPFNSTINSAILYYTKPQTPLLSVLSNTTNKLFLYNILAHEWSTYTVSNSNLVYPTITFDSNGFRFLIANSSELTAFYVINSTLKRITTLNTPTNRGGFLADVNNYIVYAPGGGSSTLYVYYENGTLAYNTDTPEPVDSYTCTTIDPISDILYVYFGHTGDLYEMSLDSNGQPTFTKRDITPTDPTIYPVGLAYGNGKLWLIGKGGGIHYIYTNNWTAKPLTVQPPYYPLTDGDRLVYYNEELYHVREDGTSELWIIRVG